MCACLERNLREIKNTAKRKLSEIGGELMLLVVTGPCGARWRREGGAADQARGWKGAGPVGEGTRRRARVRPAGDVREGDD